MHEEKRGNIGSDLARVSPSRFLPYLLARYFLVFAKVFISCLKEKYKYTNGLLFFLVGDDLPNFEGIETAARRI